MGTLTVTVDCRDPVRLAEFWAALLGYERQGGVAQYASIRPTDGGVRGPKLIFQAVPEPKVGKNRLHLDIDLEPGEPLAPAVERAVALGATLVGEVVEEHGLRWQVLADPEGNELCIVAEPG
ncbi:MAG TPA: VOC family protein [Acidimicrobiales bacterium]|nr:VOC family protein [Acidimicrobiales bacterium]